MRCVCFILTRARGGGDPKTSWILSFSLLFSLFPIVFFFFHPFFQYLFLPRIACPAKCVYSVYVHTFPLLGALSSLSFIHMYTVNYLRWWIFAAYIMPNPSDAWGHVQITVYIFHRISQSSSEFSYIFFSSSPHVKGSDFIDYFYFIFCWNMIDSIWWGTQ